MSDSERSELSEAIDLEDNQGFATALNILGEANRRAHDGEKMVVEFQPKPDGVQIMDITEHVEELEPDE